MSKLFKPCRKNGGKRTAGEAVLISCRTIEDECMTWKDGPTDEVQLLDKNENHVPRKSDESGDSLNALAIRERRKPVRSQDLITNVELTTFPKNERDTNAIRKALRADEFFMTIADDAIDELVLYMSERSVRSDEMIIRMGDTNGDSMYVSKSGKYEVQTRDQGIVQFSNTRLFGEVAILCDTPRNATVRALTDGELWTLRRDVFKHIVLKFKKQEDEALLQFLKRVPGIKDAPDEKVQRIANFCKPRTYHKDAPIVHEGTKGNDMYIVKSGSAIVSKQGVGKMKSYVRGDFFGEKALLSEEKRSVSVTAGPTGVVCLILSRGEFSENFGDMRAFINGDEKDALDLKSPVKSKVLRHEEYKNLSLVDLKFDKVLGQGAFGKVELVTIDKTKYFALKSMKIKMLENAKCTQIAYNEKNILQACDSMFIVDLYRTFKDSEKLYYLLEYCPRGELFAILMKKRKLPEVATKFVAACVLGALSYLHQHSYVYLDLKAENIIIDIDGYPKLTDFGCAKELTRGVKLYTVLGTPEYLPPEMLRHAGYDKSADYWAFGVLVYEMTFGHTPFLPKHGYLDYKKIVNNIVRGLSHAQLQKFETPALRDFCKRLLEVNPAKRLGCLPNGSNDLFHHYWFQDFSFSQLHLKQIHSPILSFFRN